MKKNDPIGQAIWDYHEKANPQDIVVKCDIMIDDVLPIDYLFRTYEDFPEIEKKAMARCEGRILDIGTAAGPHARYLVEKGFDVTTIDFSEGAHRYLKSTLPEAKHILGNIYDHSEERYDTLLLLMNGIGIAKEYDEVVPFLEHLASLLNKNGRILCESTDVLDIFEDESGGFWFDLNAQYYGEFNFNMTYKDHESGWFKWVYLDRSSFKSLAKKAGFKVTFIYDNEDTFLVELKKEV